MTHLQYNDMRLSDYDRNQTNAYLDQVEIDRKNQEEYDAIIDRAKKTIPGFKVPVFDDLTFDRYWYKKLENQMNAAVSENN